MPSLNVTRSYRNGAALTKLDIDAFLADIEALVNVILLDDSNFQSNGIDTVKLIDGTVTTAKLADLSITASKIPDANITTAKITDANVTTAKIADLAITTAKITDANVTTAKIADGAVTLAEQAALNYQLASSSSSTYSQASGTNANITNMSISLTTSGRPVWIQLQSDTTANDSYLGTAIDQLGNASIDTAGYRWTIYRDSTEVGHAQARVDNSTDTGLQLPVSAAVFIDTPAAGTYTYTAKLGWASNDRGSARCYYAKLVAFEL